MHAQDDVLVLAWVHAGHDAAHWEITFTGKESTQSEYKFALGS